MKKIILLFISFCLSAEQIETLFGKADYSEPILIDLFESLAVNRMKQIDQHGIAYYYHDSPTFTRFDHSVGVFQLLRRFGAPLKEQVAGLLHDVSHTTFSHVGDHIFNHQDGKESYQDTIHQWFLRKIGLEPILEKYNLTPDEIVHKNPEFQMLEQDLPDLCIDRLEYNLRTAYVYNLLTKEDIEQILSDIAFENGKWVFHTPTLARKLSNVSLYFTENLWGSDWNMALCHWSAKAINRAIEINLLTLDDVHTSTDRQVFDKLTTSSDPTIIALLHKCKNYRENFTHSPDFNFYISPKFRGIDPLIKRPTGYARLSELDPEYAREYIRVRTKVSKGYSLKL